ncbi:MAG: hypothetical protein QM809_05280 [Gordonia sp. (in: high G+C Gram-positive bacteria)]|uniref:hypothetical protein n=1 Tax=Gordonia sp. (in: high G+C Gram-positive bacteria) TaxID=84139 RepID=UPI0039E52458
MARDTTSVTQKALTAWRWLHAVAAAGVPWIFYTEVVLGHPTLTLAEEARQAETDSYTGAAISAVFLVCTLLLRSSGPSPAATFPFAGVWTLGIAMWLWLAVDARVSVPCQVDRCMPGVGVYIFGFFAAMAVSFAVAFSALVALLTNGQGIRFAPDPDDSRDEKQDDSAPSAP